MVYQTWRCWMTPLILSFIMTCEPIHVRRMQLVVLLQWLRRRHLQLRLRVWLQHRIAYLWLLGQTRVRLLMLPYKENWEF